MPGSAATPLALSFADGRALCEECVVADNPFTRLRGLLGRRGPGYGRRAPAPPLALDPHLVHALRDRRRLPRRRAPGPARHPGREAVALRRLPRRTGRARAGVRSRPQRAASASEIASSFAMPPELTRPIALVAGAAASFAAALEFDASGRTAAAVFFLSVLAVLSAIDVEERRIPNRIVLPAAAVMLALQIALEPGRALEWTAAALGAGALLLVLARLHPAGLGLGDVKLALLLGAALGGGVLAALALGRSWPGCSAWGSSSGTGSPPATRRSRSRRSSPSARPPSCSFPRRAPSQAGKTDLRWPGELVEAAAQHTTTSSMDALAFVLGEHGVDDAAVAAARVRAGAADAMSAGAADGATRAPRRGDRDLRARAHLVREGVEAPHAGRRPRGGGRGRRAGRARVRRGCPESGDARAPGGPCDRGPAGAARRLRRRSRGVALARRGRRRQLRCDRRCTRALLRGACVRVAGARNRPAGA